MPITTYLSKYQIKDFKILDKDVLEWKKEVERISGKEFIIEEQVRTWREGLIFKHTYVKIVYSLYFHISGTECQIMNFPPTSPGDNSICTLVDRGRLISYLIGYVAGMEEIKNANTRRI